MTIGYTTGVYDLFHIGHLNLLKNAKGLCDKLIVGVTVDELVKYKNKCAVIPFEERLEIVRSIKYVDAAIPQEDIDKFAAWEKLKFDILFVGDDWYHSERWEEMEEKFKRVGVKIVYFPYTKGISSTIINQTLISLRGGVYKTLSQSEEERNAFCRSSYLAFRYIERDDMDFFEGLHHRNIEPVKSEDKIKVTSAEDIDAAIEKSFSVLRGMGKKLGLMLSGGMDSAILASYMRGADAYTFRFLDGTIYEDELERAKYYAETYGLNLHYVDINWQTIEPHIDSVMKNKCAPVHSIEPQLVVAAEQAKVDGVEMMIVGESSDLLFGGMDKLLSRDWKFDDFVKRYTFTDPAEVLVKPVDMSYLFERYRQGDKIDFLKFMDDVFSTESSSSYLNAFETAQIDYFDPYANLQMSEPLDLYRVRHGEPKYLIRELFAKKYPLVPVPEKVPMPRPVDFYFADWKGPTRPEFKKNLDMKKFTGNQKWQLYCLERFLNLFDPLPK